MDTHNQAISDHQKAEQEAAQRRVAATTLLDFSRNPVRFPLQGLHPLAAREEDAEMMDVGNSEWATTEGSNADAEMSDSQATEILEGGFRRLEDRGGDAGNYEDSDSDLTDIIDELTPPTSPARVGGESIIPAPRRAQRESDSPKVTIRHGKNWWREAQAADAAEMSEDEEPRSLEQVEWISMMALGPQKTREKLRRQLRGEQGDEVEEQERMFALEEPIVISSDDEDEDYAARKKRKTRASKGKGKGKKVIPDEESSKGKGKAQGKKVIPDEE